MTNLPTTAIRPRTDQPRHRFDAEPLQELADSIRELGIVEPLIVRPADGGWEIVAGERRWRAAQLAGLAEVPVVIREDLGDEAAFRVSMVENVVRADMNPMETARGFGRMMASGSDTDEIARQTGIGKRKVQQSLSLLRLDALIADLVEKGHLDEWTASRLATLSPNGQHRAMRIIQEHGLHGNDRDRVIGQVWCEEHEVTIFAGAMVDAPPTQDPAKLRGLRELSGKVARLLEELDELMARLEPDEQTVLVIESVARTASRVARASRAARTARLVRSA